MALINASDEVKVLLDALPYIDSEYDNPVIQSEVRSLIEQEMASMQPRDYLAHLPSPPSSLFSNNEMLSSEMERIADGQRLAPLEVSRYEVSGPPKELSRDPQAWRASLANAQAQLEHQHNRLANLELLDRYGSQAWLQQNGALFKMQSSMVATSEIASKSAEAANLKRKVAQETAAPRMGVLQNNYYQALKENQEVAVACAMLKSDVKKLKAEAESAGLVMAAQEVEQTLVEGSGLNGGTLASEVDLYAGGEVTGMEN